MHSDLDALNKLVGFKSELNMIQSNKPTLNVAFVDQYSCEICGKSFKHKNSVYNHMAKHEGATRCPICNQVLGQKSNMKRHLRHIHGVVSM